MVWILREMIRVKEKDESGPSIKSDRSDTRKLPLTDSGKRPTDNKKGQIKVTETEIRLTFEAGRISGQGNDKNGPYYWDGSYQFLGEIGSEVKWQMQFARRYIGRYAITYEANYFSKDSFPIIFKGSAKDGGTEKQFELSLPKGDKKVVEVVSE